MDQIGFHVWNPGGRLPTYVHATLEGALAEKERLRRENPDERFVVMAPVLDMQAADTALAYSQGLADGYENARPEILVAEEAYKALGKTLSKADAVTRLMGGINDHMASAADCLLWFDGFNAAHAMRPGHERPDIPNRVRLANLVAVLKRVMVSIDRKSDPQRVLMDDEIPF